VHSPRETCGDLKIDDIGDGRELLDLGFSEIRRYSRSALDVSRPTTYGRRQRLNDWIATNMCFPLSNVAICPQELPHLLEGYTTTTEHIILCWNRLGFPTRKDDPFLGHG
jgi:hypothetical protein